jgi:hypothetical protein
MAKNVVLCCDGTANEFTRDKTSVVKLFYTLVHDSPGQRTYYHPGLGTMEATGAITMTARKVTKLLGKAIGYGLEADIRDAYVFLMHHFEQGDRVFFFGFSRGAYTVRAVAALLHMYGLIRPGNEPLVPYAIRMMMAIRKLTEDKSAATDAPVVGQAVLEWNVQRVEDCFPVVCPIVVAAGVVRSFAESKNPPQGPGVTEAFAQHEGAIMAICYSNSAAVDDGAEVRIQT